MFLHFSASDYLSIVWKFMKEAELLWARRWYWVLDGSGYWIALHLSGMERRKGKIFWLLRQQLCFFSSRCLKIRKSPSCILSLSFQAHKKKIEDWSVILIPMSNLGLWLYWTKLKKKKKAQQPHMNWPYHTSIWTHAVKKS